VTVAATSRRGAMVVVAVEERGVTRQVTPRQSQVTTSASPHTLVQLGKQGETDVGAQPGQETRTLVVVPGKVTQREDEDEPVGPLGTSMVQLLQSLHLTWGGPAAIAT